MSDVPALRVLSIPGTGHPYVAHLAPVSGPVRAFRLPDPPVPGAPPGQWWPPVALQPEHLRAHAGDVDLLHLHFGFEHRTATELTETVRALRDVDLPLVLTVHDLELPHAADQRAHRAALDVLVPAAAAVLTLTEGAAGVLRERYRVPVTVVPHPHVVPLARMATAVPERTGRVGLLAKPRASNDPAAVRDELAAAVAACDGELAPELDRRLPDAALWDHLASLDVLVLAYRWGTHSGFVEACADLGTAVVAPRTGFLAEQRPVHGYDLDAPGSLTAAVRAALGSGPPAPLTVAERSAQRDRVAAVHDEVYERVLAGALRAGAA